MPLDEVILEEGKIRSRPVDDQLCSADNSILFSLSVATERNRNN